MTQLNEASYSYGEQKASTFHETADLARFILHLPNTLNLH